MTVSTAAQYDIEVEDIEYLRHAGTPLLARVYRPKGAGPFPLIIDTHGGVWYKHDRLNDAHTDEPLARSGAVVVALDFRQGPEFKYPASSIDINYGIRWCKAHAREWNSHPDRVGVRGASSGGHLAMLAALRPFDPRYASIPLKGHEEIDASVRCALLSWPVIDSLGRYQYAQELIAKNVAKLLDLANEYVREHINYWGSEAAMSEGSPTLALERGEAVAMPAVLYLSRPNDTNHPRANLERFVAAYQKAGGRLELHWLGGSNSEEAIPEARDLIIDYVHREFKSA
jgi:hypothetical protein